MCNHENKDCFDYVDSKMPRIPISLIVNEERIYKDVDPTMTL